MKDTKDFLLRQISLGEVIGAKVVDIIVHDLEDGMEELEIMLDNGHCIEFILHDSGKIHVQTD